MDLNTLLETAGEDPNSAGDNRVAELRASLQSADTEVDLAAIAQEANEQFEQLYNGGDYEPQYAGKLLALIDVLDATHAEQDQIAAAQQDVDDKLANAAARLSAPADDAGDAGDDAGDAGEQASSDDTEQATGDDDSGADPAGEDTTTPAENQERQPVSASRQRSGRVSAAQLNKHRPQQATPEKSTAKRRLLMTAAADVPQTPAGQQLDMRGLAEATRLRFQAMPIGAPNTNVRNGLAIITRETDESLSVQGDHNDLAKIDAVADERNLPGGNLVAAAEQNKQALTAAATQQGTFVYGGAWCAPSETDYSLCPSLATNEGIADFPSITIRHGGIRYPSRNQYPDFDFAFQDFDENADFETTPKTCVSGVCPTWTEERLRLAPLCVKGDIPRERGYPELTEAFLDDVLVKHQHFMNALRLNWVDTNSTALASWDASADGMGSASHGIADRIGLLVSWMRETYRMGRNTTLEGIAPMWLIDLLKADIAKRNNRPSTAVSDAEVNDVFAQRGARVQWVYDWGGMNPGGASATTPATAWPDAANILLYPAGSWVSGEQEIITLDAIYDSSDNGLPKNQYTQLFTETGWLMLNRCNPSYKVQLTGLCANGAMGPFRDVCPPATTSGTTTTA